ncbi:TPA: TonB-dependent receptor [Stenotrophomonas maltophilia]
MGSYTQWRGLGSLRMGKNRWTGVYSAQYIGSADDIIAVPDTIGSHVSSVVYHSLQLSYGIKKKWDISAGVEKVLDKKAPFVKNNPNTDTDTMTYDLLGRRWNVCFGYHW